MTNVKKIGLIAGGGRMPFEIVKYCKEKGIEVFIVALKNFAEKELYENAPHVVAGIGEAGKIINALKKNDIVDVVLAGGIKRPSFKELIPDWEGAKIVAKLAMKKLGDDGMFCAVIKEFENRGFKILGIEEVVPEMLFSEGIYGKVKPSSEDMDDINRGIQVALALGKVDVGQAVVVQEGMVLAVEAIEGTDKMLERAASVMKKGKAPVMVKIMKPGQDTRVDMPAIGLLTIEQLIKHGIKGIAVQSGGILIIEREEVIKTADKAGMFIIGVTIPAELPCSA